MDIKGSKLWDSIEQMGPIFITDQLNATIEGNSLSADAMPDLTLAMTGTKATWCSTDEDLGRDHRLIKLVVENSVMVKTRNNKAKETIWYGAFGEIHDIENWCRAVIRAINDSSEDIQAEGDTTLFDCQMSKLWRTKKTSWET